MALQCEIKESGDETFVLFRGRIDEGVGDALGRVNAQLKTRRLHFDCGGITRINSIGVTIWLKALDSFADRTYSFSNCNEQFIDAAVMIPQFPGKGWIDSIRVQFHCDSCDTEESRLFSTRDGQPPDLNVDARCPKCQGPLEPGADLAGNLESLGERGSFKPRT